MYIQLKDFNSYMSPQNKDWLYIFVVISVYYYKPGATFT